MPRKIQNDAGATGFQTHIPAEIKNATKVGNLARVHIIGYTGAAVDLSDYGIDAPVVYNLQGITQAKSKTPYLLNHSPFHPLGHLENTVNDGTKLATDAIHSYPSAESREVAEAVENGMPYQASMGLELDLESVTYHAEGQVVVNGRTFTGPIYHVGKSKLTELSACLFGRDGDTEVTKLSKDTLMTIKNAAGGTPTVDPPATPTTTPVVENKPATPVVPPATPANSNPSPAPVAPAATANSNPAPAPLPATPTNSLPENDRVAALEARMQLHADWMFEHQDHPELVRNAIKEGWTDERLKNEVKIKTIENSYPAVPGVWIPNNNKDNSFLARMALSVGIAPEFLESKLGKPVVENADKAGTLGFKESIMLCANAEGGRFNGHSDVENMTNFIKKRVQNNAFSTIDFPNLMHQIARWKLEEAWLLEAPFAPEICKKESNKDFRLQGHMKPRGGEMWNGLNKDGKIEHGKFGAEDMYLTQLHTYAQIVTFKREDIINDDIGWVAMVLDLMVEGAMMIPDYQLVNLIYNARPGFAAVLEADTSYFTLPLTADNLETVYNAVKHRTIDKGGKAVKARTQTKWWLVVSPGLEKAAWEIIKQDQFVQGPTGDYVGRNNYWKDKFDIKEFAQLDNVTYNANALEGTWGLVPQNTKYSPFAMSLLNGQTRPTTETVDLPMDCLGFGVRGYWDVALDYRTMENEMLQATAFSFPTNES